MADKEKRTLNDVDRFYIDHNPTMSVRDLSQKLKIQAESIKNYRDSKDTGHIAPAKPEKDQAFLRKGQAVVMTKAASEQGDRPFIPKLDESCIFRPFKKNNDDPLG